MTTMQDVQNALDTAIDRQDEHGTQSSCAADAWDAYRTLDARWRAAQPTTPANERTTRRNGTVRLAVRAAGARWACAVRRVRAATSRR